MGSRYWRLYFYWVSLNDGRTAADGRFKLVGGLCSLVGHINRHGVFNWKLNWMIVPSARLKSLTDFAFALSEFITVGHF